jgi:hypothetical protein
MRASQLTFVIPTIRLRDVGYTIQAYDENFWKSGHAANIIIFDDSSLSLSQKYFHVLEETPTYNDVFYVGPKEKEEFLSILNRRLNDRKLESIVKNLFRPSYGGNRNFTLMYTLGDLVVSSDDDMRPHALIEESPESLDANEISRGKLIKANKNGHVRKEFDILTSFSDVLGKRVSDLPDNYDRGDHLLDTAMELETNASKGLSRINSLTLSHGTLKGDCVVKMAQTFRSGTSDYDALDYVEMFLQDENQTGLDTLNDLYVLVNFRPAVTKNNWRMDCGVAGYDNRLGLPPFFPTRLRFEDYIYRLWIQQDNICSAQVDSAQTHTKSHYMRNPLASEVFNEEIANLLKVKIKNSLSKLDDLSIAFDYDGEVTGEDASSILGRIKTVYGRVVEMVETCKNPERKETLGVFAVNLEKAFYGFDPDFFQQNVSRIVDDVVSQTKSCIELWPTLIEIFYLQKHRRGLPQIKIKNKRRTRADA